MPDTNKLYEFFLKYPSISTDTRKNVSNSIFFALSGENFNGNKFAEQALSKGAKLAVIDDNNFEKGEGYYLVENVEKSLQELAKIHRKNYQIPLLAITGSNGKTTTKELISAVLGSTKKIISTHGNYNNHLGVPLTILRINDETELAVIEMGANHQGEIEMLCNIAEPDYGIITNIGKAHLEGFGGYEGVIKAKSELYRSLAKNQNLAIVNADDPLLLKLSSGLNRFTYGTKQANITGSILSLKPFLSLSWKHDKKVFELNTNLYGKYNLPNVLAAIATGIFFGIDPEKINESINQYIPENNRSQKLTTTTNNIILDAYNANPVSMAEAILSFKDAEFENPFLILGDMFELGEAAHDEHFQIIRKLEESGFKNGLLVGKEFLNHKPCNNFISFETTQQAAEYLDKYPVKHSNILIKGSRGMKLETLVTFL